MSSILPVRPFSLVRYFLSVGSVALISLCSNIQAMAQGSLLDSEGTSYEAHVSAVAQRAWMRALAKATQTGPNSAIFHQSSNRDLRLAAESGHPLAQYYAGELFLAHALVSGDTILGLSGAGDAEAEWNITDSEGIKWLEKSAGQGIALAQYELYVAYINGQGVSKNPAVGETWLRKAASQGLAKAQYDLGTLSEKQGKFSEAQKWNQLAAKQHYIRAVNDQYLFDAHRYINDLSLDDLKKAAASGDAVAMRILGVELQPGGNKARNFSPNLPQALAFELRSAELGDPIAEYNVGWEYYKGKFRTKSDQIAFDWILKAAEAGVPVAQCYVALSYQAGNPVERNSDKAVEWFERAVAQGSDIAAVQLGMMYLNGEGVRQSYLKAVRLFDIAARQGNATGIREYMQIFNQGYVVYRDGAVVANRR